MTKEPLLLMENIAVNYDNSPIFESFNLSLNKHETLGLTGPSGCGKSTILRVAVDLVTPSEGTVTFEGRNVCDWNPIELRRRMILVTQEPSMFAGSVRDNLLWGLRVHGLSADDAQLEEILEEVVLWPSLLEKNAQNLSGGQKQRVSIARALLLTPDVLLLDEPSSALDEESSLAVEEAINQLLNEREIGVIIVTHNKEQAERFTSRVIEMKGGSTNAR
jgi:putative ABC transport system ATP-binding protein